MARLVESGLHEEQRPTVQERRAHPRVTLKTSIHFASESNFYTGLTRDISEGGVFVATHHVLPQGTVIDIEFSLPDDGEPIAVQGEVRWSRLYNPLSDACPGIGVRFVDLQDEVRERIERFVAQRDTLFYED